MFSYPLTFPNSDPALAMRMDNLAYLVTAIACSANVPAELVWISYVRADEKYVGFSEPPHTTVGLVENCSSLAPPLRSQNISTVSMRVVIYYLSPKAAKPSDAYFYMYAGAISSLPGSSSYGSGSSGFPGFPGSSGFPSESPNISAGGIVGIVLGVLTALGLVAGLFWWKRRKETPVKVVAPAKVNRVESEMKFMRSSYAIPMDTYKSMRSSHPVG